MSISKIQKKTGEVIEAAKKESRDRRKKGFKNPTSYPPGKNTNRENMK